MSLDLHFNLIWTTPEPVGNAADATAGMLAVSVCDELVWGHEEGDEVRGLRWTWIELFEWLAEAWPYLIWEQVPPLDLRTERPSRLRGLAEERWEELPMAAVEREDDVLHSFEDRHDLSRALQGMWVAPLWIVREGDMALVETRRTVRRLTHREVLEALEQLGNAIAARIHTLGDPRAVFACVRWRSRGDLQPVDRARIATSLPSTVLERITAGTSAVELFEIGDSPIEETEAVAVARMAGCLLDSESLRSVIDRACCLAKTDTPQLDALTQAVRDQRDALEVERDYEQGLALARWLRMQMYCTNCHQPEYQHALKEKCLFAETSFSREAVADDAPFGVAHDPEAALRWWGVALVELELTNSELDAIAVWGPRHGPAVLLNQLGRHAQGVEGRRATLAHEILHLLIDRDRGLPLAEVLGGRTPRHLERRANAFAAEFLVPRVAVVKVLSLVADPLKAVDQLRQRFGASRDIVAWQGVNAYEEGAPVPERVVDTLRNMLKRPR